MNYYKINSSSTWSSSRIPYSVVRVLDEATASKYVGSSAPSPDNKREYASSARIALIRSPKRLVESHFRQAAWLNMLTLTFQDIFSAVLP